MSNKPPRKIPNFVKQSVFTSGDCMQLDQLGVSFDDT